MLFVEGRMTRNKICGQKIVNHVTKYSNIRPGRTPCNPIARLFGAAASAAAHLHPLSPDLTF